VANCRICLNLNIYIRISRFDVQSPKAGTLTNGRRVVRGRKFNETVTFTCDPGFTLSGSSVRTCRGLGTWDGVEPKCVELVEVRFVCLFVTAWIKKLKKLDRWTDGFSVLITSQPC
jgi:hypothetical protein